MPVRGGAQILASVLAATALCACGSTPAGGATGGHSLTVSEPDNGRTLAVTRGTQIVLRLHNTHWSVRRSSNSTVVKETGRERRLPAPFEKCLPGIGCGTVVADFQAVGRGSAELSARRTTCGEALRCTGGRGRFEVRIRVTG
jgi:hypothetical protein